MKTLSALLILCLLGSFAFAQQSIEIKPNELSLKGQDAQNNDRLGIDATGVTRPKRTQELKLIRNYVASPGTAQGFTNNSPTKLDFTINSNEKKNNSTSNVDLTNDFFLTEESGMYAFDLTLSWTTAMDGTVTIEIIQTGIIYSNVVRRRSDDPATMVISGLVELDAGLNAYVRVNQITGAAKSAIFTLKIAKL
ncbi:hypothetical protein [Runella sp.]|uniref:hypothetical protein n=1 Tax=Runella sp. TaxID=1960881 RepID=UPI003D0E6D05